ncbi:MAG: outer membrane beta-barrel protein [Nitrospinae bacterium]|nr:outer membrane beta-barrel protein [Nitrospinota bacterium]
MDTAKSRSIWLAILLGAVLMVPTQSFAQIYVGAYGGAVFPHDADTEIDAILGVDIPSISSSDIEFDTGVMFGARVGYWLEALGLPMFGVEGEFYWGIPEISGQDVTLAGILPVPIQEADFNVGTIGINLLARYPYYPIQPYVGVGLAILFADIDDIKLSVPPVGTVFLRGDDDTAAGLQLMGGLRGFVTDNIALFAEYKWVLAELEFADFEIDYSASHVYGGVEWHFGTGGVHQKP